MAPPSFVGGSETSASVASLDPPLVQQTKSEIRILAGEIAELAHASISPDEFYEGFLPRLCVAMGASGAAIWKVSASDEFRLQAEHTLAPQLHVQDRPSDAHAAILRCIVSEGQPIWVPPSGVELEADRPTNPLHEALIVVPVRIEERIEYVLEVTQRPSGGPAAQRGYLRFVAQMADLLADYGRRQQLRELSASTHRLDRLETWLLRIAGASRSQDKAQASAEALAELLSADQALLLFGRSRPKVHALGHVATFDPRSEIVLAANRLARLIALEGSSPLTWLVATDRRGPEPALSPKSTDASEAGPSSSPLQIAVDRLCDQLRCRRLLIARVPADGTTSFVLGYASNCPVPEQLTPDWESSTIRLVQSVSALSASETAASNWLLRLPGVAGHAKRSGRERAQRLAARLTLVGLAAAVALFPVPQQITAMAILQPTNKSSYYAPMSGVVSEILVSEGDVVTPGQPIAQMTSRELDHQIDQTEGELQVVEERIGQLTDVRNRGSDLTSSESDRLEGELEQLRVSRSAHQRQLAILRDQQKELHIVARAGGQVSSWDLENRLLNRPVSSGELLATTFQVEGPWRLQLSIPDYRVGMIRDAMESGEHGATVRYSLSSHPDQLRDAVLIKLASHATPDVSQPESGANRFVLAEAVLDAERLPMKKDGAIAHTTIDCGRVPAIWLACRDAYWAVSSRFQMIW